jgi:hypothetical protein
MHDVPTTYGLKVFIQPDDTKPARKEFVPDPETPPRREIVAHRTASDIVK